MDLLLPCHRSTLILPEFEQLDAFNFGWAWLTNYKFSGRLVSGVRPIIFHSWLWNI